ncbi:peptide-methionine (R)-S-oxide reductase [bacterium (Candidatus Blackallbacteria) CG17_big_fil_post_rev_8_21_14_2_50_48_46]|uniref:peptide-methionine (R)-S-oxide reductase n=1 Tax=bacterium (Candidatus Blackallbacteria) CG17_big_fil_post_rev_8_21_14_2_50_48_46 TaxID=2014261 RepID=A0A2M7G8F6_9BACT|nr:MAG: peptide-methionine (R)-S-oxide reductase [bacterium (Candidatus Blackallbacteria) CG18_big_fil_WC_8_21_14_2_50_49_26]PIW18393.1 MAG: peptide-methionine (R)-S-oxide reductase [bacterium (Candidatus Blackallbacteria) CG17_big_fil_post_rev_8_21_14_2_50_48_46]PIW50552.1 MAG: peptide-methionine (R)-S-oxide reductase [bacterium (Candidatus Blackallbacteria) CG13_big_fil_rev_8_21_14_2_50_49_14]
MLKKFICCFFSLGLCFGLSACKPSEARNQQESAKFPVQKTNAEWKKILSPEAYHVLREQGTERAFTSPLHSKKDPGIYYCRACKQPLFSSQDKFNSGTGWPSFTRPLKKEQIGTSLDHSLFGSERTEVHCSRCGGHLGHVFADGPAPTGLRYCMNGVALEFKAGHPVSP